MISVLACTILRYKECSICAVSILKGNSVFNSLGHLRDRQLLTDVSGGDAIWAEFVVGFPFTPKVFRRVLRFFDLKKQHIIYFLTPI